MAAPLPGYEEVTFRYEASAVSRRSSADLKTGVGSSGVSSSGLGDELPAMRPFSATVALMSSFEAASARLTAR
jgi:hypothetical protein